MSRLFDMALGARAATTGYEIGVGRAVRKYVAEQTAEKHALVNKANDIFREKNDRIRELELQLAICDAQVEGLKAQVETLQELGASSPYAFRDSDKSFSDGTKKSEIRLIFETRFDAYLASCGITNPHEHRKN